MRKPRDEVRLQMRRGDGTTNSPAAWRAPPVSYAALEPGQAFSFRLRYKRYSDRNHGSKHTGYVALQYAYVRC